MAKKPVIIIGNGGHARSLMDTLLIQKRVIIGYTAPEKNHNPYNLHYLGTDEGIFAHNPESVELINALGSTSRTVVRKKLFEKMKKAGYMFSNVIHPASYLAHQVEIGEGVQIMAGAVIQPFSIISDNSIINTNVSIDHDCQIGAHCHIAPGTTISGLVTIKESTHVGTGSTIIQGVQVGSNVLIGAGSLVLKSIKSGVTVYGNPAKEVKLQ